MAIRLCPECGKKCSTTRDDCPHCGYVFVKEKICPECESSIPADATECPECGFTFETEEKTPANMPEVPMEDPAPKAKIVAMTCPNCGATEAIQLGEDRFKCQCCGTPFAYDKGPSTVVNGDVIVQQTKNGLPRGVSGKTFTGCYKIDYLTSEDDAKLILLESAYNKDAIDYVDMRIKNVTKLILPMAVAHYAFDIKYQVLIGNDRKEQYVAMEKVRENGQEFTRPVTKERTVTDWRPFEGTVKPTTSDGWWNKSPELPTTDISPALVLYCYADWLKKAEPYDGEIVPDLSEFDTNFSVNAKIEAEKAVKNFGDHQKDLRYEWDGVLTDLHCALIPTYQIEVESHGKPYCATVLGAFVKVCGWNNKRSPGRSGSANYQAEVDAIRKKRGQGFKRIKNTSSLMAIVGLLIVLFVILEAYSGCFASFWFLLIPGVASAAIGGYLTYYCKKNVNATKDGFKGDDFAERYQDAIRNVKSVFFNQASEAAGLSARKTVDDALPKSIEELEKWKNGVRASTSKQKEKKPDTKEKKPEAGDVEIAPVAVAPIVNEPAAAPAVAEEEAPKDEAPVEAAPATDEPAVSPAVVEEEPKIVEEAPTPDEVPVAVAPIVNEPAAAPAVAEEEAPKDEAPMADEAPVTAAPAEEPAPRKEKPVEPSVAPTPVEKAPKAKEEKPKGEKKEEPAKGEPSQKRKSKKKKIIIGSVIAAALAVVTPAGFAIKQLTVPFAAWEIKYKAISPHEVVAVGLAEETTSLGFPSEFSHASTRFTVVKIEDRAFAGCNSLNFVDTGHVPEIGQNAFSDCKNLKRVTVGSKKVGAMAFAFCHSLSNVELYADTIEEIGRDAFAGIASDNISVQYIGASGQGGGSCFYLNYLRSFFNDPKIAIEHGCRFVNEIQGDAIRAIYVPETVKHISPMAFENCPFLTDIVYQGSPTAWSRIGAEDITLGIKLENINFHYDVSQAEWDAMVF